MAASVYSMAKPNGWGSLAKRATSGAASRNLAKDRSNSFFAGDDIEDCVLGLPHGAGPGEGRGGGKGASGFEELGLTLFDAQRPQLLAERRDANIVGYRGAHPPHSHAGETTPRPKALPSTNSRTLGARA